MLVLVGLPRPSVADINHELLIGSQRNEAIHMPLVMAKSVTDSSTMLLVQETRQGSRCVPASISRTLDRHGTHASVACVTLITYQG